MILERPTYLDRYITWQQIVNWFPLELSLLLHCLKARPFPITRGKGCPQEWVSRKGMSDE